MLGVTGILVGVLLASIFMQTVLAYSALRTGVAFLPFALAITVGTIVARHLLAHLSPRAVATSGLVIVAVAAGLVAAVPADSRYAVELLPGLLSLGLGWVWVFAPVSVSSMAGIPASHAGVASGFLMTRREIGAALGVAVLSAVASTAGSLATQGRRRRSLRARVRRDRWHGGTVRRGGHAPYAGGTSELGDCGYAHALR
jgi:Na+/melibiose symporter-like transporter